MLCMFRSVLCTFEALHADSTLNAEVGDISKLLQVMEFFANLSGSFHGSCVLGLKYCLIGVGVCQVVVVDSIIKQIDPLTLSFAIHILAHGDYVKCANFYCEALAEYHEFDGTASTFWHQYPLAVL